MERTPDPVTDINHCPECGKAIDVSDFAPFSKIICPHCDAAIRVRTTLGHYRITTMLGEGGMSKVFKAEDINLGREVALKILHQELSEDKALTAMFEREAKLTAAIQHPNVVKVYAVGRDQGYFFIAMELVDAISLEQLIAQKGAHSEETALSIAHDVTSGLRAAYQSGLIHRDIKPGNMLVTGEGTTKLVDFGLAVQHGTDDDSDDLWATPFYVPPEKLDGASDTFLGDIYSLGATLYHALAGNPPFLANTSSLEELKTIKAEAISLKDDAPGTSKSTVKLVSRMMSYDPSGRPQDYDALLDAIEEIQAKSFGTVHKRGRSNSEQRSLIMKVGGAAVALAAIGIVVLATKPGIDRGELADPLATKSDNERVISAGANTNAEQFLEARSLMAAGKFSRAEQIFSVLAGEATLSPSARAWTIFHRGLIGLFEGDDERAVARFSELQGLDSFAGEDPALAEQEEFLRDIGTLMRGPLPPMPNERKVFEQDSVRVLGLLAGGVKTWNAGQFGAGLDWLEAFAGAEVPSDLPWIAELQSLVERYRSDFSLLGSLPNPSMQMSKGELKAAADEILAAMPEVRTGGQVASLLEKRRERVPQIMEQKEEARRVAALASSAKGKASPKAGSKGAEPAVKANTKTKTKSAAKGMTPMESVERDRIATAWQSAIAPADFSTFSLVRERMQSLVVETPLGLRLQTDLIRACDEAERFVTTLSEAVAESGFEGEVRRREGRVLDAKITGATSTTWIVDLGFGPNEVPVELFDPKWLLEVAEASFPEPDASDEALTVWTEAAWFALLSGSDGIANGIAGRLAPESDEFAARWERVGGLQDSP